MPVHNPKTGGDFSGGTGMTVLERAKKARQASFLLASAALDVKNRALEAVAQALAGHKDEILRANAEDCRRSEEEHLPAPLIKRLKFDEQKLNQVIEGIRSLILLEDPVGRSFMARELEPGLELYRVSCPVGVAGIIFESRPDALVQISSLCLKSGNAVLLKGGSEAAGTNRILTEIIRKASCGAGLPEGWIQLLESREDVQEMFRMNEYIDLLIPRGSNKFVKYIMEHSSIPVLGHADGVCHIYIHEDADPARIIPVVLDAKTQYPAACNSVETLLVNKACARAVLPSVAQALLAEGVSLVGCEESRKILQNASIGEAHREDWETEYVDLKLSIKVVENLDEAVWHINTYGSGHTDAILTEDKSIAGSFMARVDGASVFWNCSTRFADGFRYGFGAEVGISTSKIHARGPVGMEGLMSYKYKLLGRGQVVADFVGGQRSFTHKTLEKSCPL